MIYQIYNVIALLSLIGLCYGDCSHSLNFASLEQMTEGRNNVAQTTSIASSRAGEGGGDLCVYDDESKIHHCNFNESSTDISRFQEMCNDALGEEMDIDVIMTGCAFPSNVTLNFHNLRFCRNPNCASPVEEFGETWASFFGCETLEAHSTLDLDGVNYSSSSECSSSSNFGSPYELMMATTSLSSEYCTNNIFSTGYRLCEFKELPISPSFEAMCSSAGGESKLFNIKMNGCVDGYGSTYSARLNNMHYCVNPACSGNPVRDWAEQWAPFNDGCSYEGYSYYVIITIGVGGGNETNSTNSTYGHHNTIPDDDISSAWTITSYTTTMVIAMTLSLLLI